MKTITIKDENGITKTYAEVPSNSQEVTKEKKPQTKYRKNGALVFAPKPHSDYYWIFIEDELGFCVEFETWNGLNGDLLLLEQGYIFDNKEACQLWADKLKIAYALKQRIVESESQDDYLEYCFVFWDIGINKKDYEYAYYQKPLIFSPYLHVSTNAKDILMKDDVSDEDFKTYIEVFSL